MVTPEGNMFFVRHWLLEVIMGVKRFHTLQTIAIGDKWSLDSYSRQTTLLQRVHDETTNIFVFLAFN